VRATRGAAHPADSAKARYRARFMSFLLRDDARWKLAAQIEASSPFAGNELTAFSSPKNRVAGRGARARGADVLMYEHRPSAPGHKQIVYGDRHAGQGVVAPDHAPTIGLHWLDDRDVSLAHHLGSIGLEHPGLRLSKHRSRRIARAARSTCTA